MSKYEDIRKRMLNNIEIDIDKREGSTTSNMLSPIALELENGYKRIEEGVKQSFIMNGQFKYLEAKCAEFGIERKRGIKANGEVIFKGENDTFITNGVVLYYNDLYFIVLNDETIVNGEATLIIEAFEVGSEYNLLANTKLNLQEQIEGVSEIVVKSNINNGADIESDEELRDRFLETIKKSYTSGNIYHYEKWATEVDGVGSCKVYPLKNGNGTVEIVITNSDMLGADEELIRNVKARIEEERPIGANVTVVSATEKAINISAKIDLDVGYTKEEVLEEYKEKVTNYLKDISFKTTYVSTARLANLLLDIIGVMDYEEFKVNSATSNTTLSDTDVPKLGTVMLVEVE